MRRGKRDERVLAACTVQGVARQSRAVGSAKKFKRDNRVVTYIRVKPEEHAQIAKIANTRGRPHTIASVAAEMISKALKMEIQ